MAQQSETIGANIKRTQRGRITVINGKIAEYNQTHPDAPVDLLTVTGVVDEGLDCILPSYEQKWGIITHRKATDNGC